MFIHYLITALRHFWKNKLITGIKVLGLTIGITMSLVIFQFIQYEYSFDREIPNRANIYRLVNEDPQYKSESMMVPLIPYLESELSGVRHIVPIFQLNGTDGNVIVDPNTPSQHLFKVEKELIFTKPEYFELFPYTWLAGNPQALKEPGKVVIDETKRKKYFPGATPRQVIGRTLVLHDSVYLQVAGVVAPYQNNSDFDYQAFISIGTISGKQQLEDIYNWHKWRNFNTAYQCLVSLSPEVSSDQVQKRIQQLISKHQPLIEGYGPDIMALQALSDVHFNTDYSYAATKASTLRALMLLGFFILALGAINFINLSTAQSLERAKEIGIRKSLGGARHSLMLQFLTETGLLTLGASLLALICNPLTFHVFQEFLPSGMSYPGIKQGGTLSFLGLQALIITLLAGYYPARVLTRYKPALALKNQFGNQHQYTRSSWVRKSLTIVQFIIAQVLLVSALVVYQQIQFAFNRDMGFRRNAIVDINIPNTQQWDDPNKWVLKQKLTEIPEIQAVGLSNQPPAINGRMTNTMDFDQAKGDKEITFNSRNGDTTFLSLFEIPLVAGRNIRLLDTLYEALINESMVRALGFNHPEDAIGSSFEKGEYTVVGVMRDFDIASVRSSRTPTMYWGDDIYARVLHIALNPHSPESWKTGITKAEAAFKDIYPDNDFNYHFLDETMQDMYFKELRLSRLLSWSVGIAIGIACLGLFGLAIFTTNRRTKEIGVRKVIGAPVAQIIYLLLKDLITLVLVACLIALPLAWFFMHQWLMDFAIHIRLSPWLFLNTALVMTLFAILTLSLRTLKAARANPVDALRDE